MAQPTPGIGSKRLVVGAHYGIAGFIGQRVTSVVLTLWLLLVGVSVLFGPLSYERWAALFSPLWMKIVTLVALFSLFYHAWIGVRDIWMDYVSLVWLRLSLQVITVLLLIGYALWSVQILWTV
ncbi:MAG: succinate dehydrogenase, hydrophobic membrane anchor protein [Burkholderiaceae bacterium]